MSADDAASSCGKDVANKVLIGREAPREARQFAHISIKKKKVTHIFSRAPRPRRLLDTHLSQRALKSNPPRKRKRTRKKYEEGKGKRTRKKHEEEKRTKKRRSTKAMKRTMKRKKYNIRKTAKRPQTFSKTGEGRSQPRPGRAGPTQGNTVLP